MIKTIEKLKVKNIRVTPQRAAVYKIIAVAQRHLTLEDIYAKVQAQFPAISLATVYAILSLYTEKDIISEIRINFDKSCFEARTDAHHHFYCRQCNRIFDIDLHPCPALQNAQVQGHVIEKLQGYFYGTCKECRKK